MKFHISYYAEDKYLCIEREGLHCLLSPSLERKHFYVERNLALSQKHRYMVGYIYRNWDRLQRMLREHILKDEL